MSLFPVSPSLFSTIFTPTYPHISSHLPPHTHISHISSHPPLHTHTPSHPHPLTSPHISSHPPLHTHTYTPTSPHTHISSHPHLLLTPTSPHTHISLHSLTQTLPETTTQEAMSEVHKLKTDFHTRDTVQTMVTYDNFHHCTVKRETGRPEKGYGSVLPTHRPEHGMR